jgi:hypothetical protein
MSKEQLNEKAEGIVSNFLDSSFVTNVKLVAKTGRTLALILAPLAVAGYLYQTQADKGRTSYRYRPSYRRKR